TNLILTAKHLEDTFLKAQDAFKDLSQDIQRSEPDELFTTETEFKKELDARFVVELSNQTLLTSHYTFESHQTPQPPFHKKFDLLIDDLQEKSEEGYTNYIFCSSEKQIERFNDIFEDIGREVKFH